MSDREAIEALLLICAVTFRELGQAAAAAAVDQVIVRLDPAPGDIGGGDVDG